MHKEEKRNQMFSPVAQGQQSCMSQVAFAKANNIKLLRWETGGFVLFDYQKNR